MSLSLDSQKQILLDLIGIQPLSFGPERQPNEADWQAMLKMARQHRLGPLLHWRLQHEHGEVAVPAPIREALTKSFKQASLRSMACQRALLALAARLDEAGIPCLALKGAYLALSSYPHGALRPLRDLDILVPQERALEAHRILRQAGYQQSHPGDADVRLAGECHLPALLTPENNITLELHVRLVEKGLLDYEEERVDKLWQRAIRRPIAGREIGFLSETDLLRHLILHAVYSHRLNNGPLTLSDVAYLVQQGNIDWPLFWQMAAQDGSANACVLVLAAAQRYYGALPMQGPQGEAALAPVPSAVSDATGMLMLCDARRTRSLMAAARLSGRPVGEKLRLIWRELFPSGAKMMVENQAWRSLRGRLWGYMTRPFAANRPGEFIESLKDPSFRPMVRRFATVDRWLDGRDKS